MVKKSLHWADITAEKIIREKGRKDRYVCASGVTPSGTVHIGNFREIISVDLVVRALKSLRENTRFIYSWDDYDVFRKVPVNMPDQDKLKKYLRQPITLTPDPCGQSESYARRNEIEIEKLMPAVGIYPEYIYQAERYRNSVYAEGIKKALVNKEIIRRILNEHRTQPLADNWWPVTVFCSSCNRDTTEITGWDGEYGISYTCTSCGNEETADLRRTSSVKLFWRVDWPMRWAFEKVDFEPAGKDHHSEGGSFDTARKIVRQVYGYEPPVTFQYDFIGIKGRGGKISSSTGEVVSLKDVLEVYQPEIVRYLFAGTRPNTEFVISFDLDVIKIYEDYDRCERIYYGLENVSEKRQEKERRIYELSSVSGVQTEAPYQLPFRHLCNLMQIHNGDSEKVLSLLKEEIKETCEDEYKRYVNSMKTLKIRAACAWNWITGFAPEDFQFRLVEENSPPVSLEENIISAVRQLAEEFNLKYDSLDERSLSGLIYSAAQDNNIEPRDFFKAVYRILIGKEKGPRLASFMLSIGREKVHSIFSRY